MTTFLHPSLANDTAVAWPMPESLSACCHQRYYAVDIPTTASTGHQSYARVQRHRARSIGQARLCTMTAAHATHVALGTDGGKLSRPANCERPSLVLLGRCGEASENIVGAVMMCNNQRNSYAMSCMPERAQYDERAFQEASIYCWCLRLRRMTLRRSCSGGFWH